MLRSVEVRRFRCVADAQLELDARTTAIIGANGSGKTSLLEAIYYLAHGRSFRTAQREKLIRRGDAAFQVVGWIDADTGLVVAGTEFGQEGRRIQLGGRALRGFSEVATILPVQVIDPGVHRVIEEGSALRRRLLDWGVFHVEREFLSLWRRYQRALQQRNAALRANSTPTVVGAWDPELAATAEMINAARERYVAAFAPVFRVWAERLLGSEAAFAYRAGWPVGEDLLTSLGSAYARDRRLRTTTVGPHRADLQFTVDGVAARDRVSRGQQKMLASAFALAQIAYQSNATDKPTCLLIDDPAAELDVDNLGKLLGALLEIRAQIVLTAVSATSFSALRVGRMFHVERGIVRPML